MKSLEIMTEELRASGNLDREALGRLEAMRAKNIRFWASSSVAIAIGAVVAGWWLLAIVIVAFGFWLARSSVRKLTEKAFLYSFGTRTKGTVSHAAYAFRVGFVAVIRYIDHKGRALEVKELVQQKSGWSIKAGEEVSILFDPGTPRLATIYLEDANEIFNLKTRG